MSDSNKAPLYTQKNVSLVSRAIQEFNKVNPKQPEENSKINSAADADSNFEKVVLQKGANIPKKTLRSRSRALKFNVPD